MGGNGRAWPKRAELFVFVLHQPRVPRASLEVLELGRELLQHLRIRRICRNILELLRIGLLIVELVLRPLEVIRDESPSVVALALPRDALPGGALPEVACE